MTIDFAGVIGPASSRDHSPVVYGLTVPNDYACSEVKAIFTAKGWGNLTDKEFNLALSRNGIRSYNT